MVFKITSRPRSYPWRRRLMPIVSDHSRQLWSLTKTTLLCVARERMATSSQARTRKIVLVATRKELSSLLTTRRSREASSVGSSLHQTKSLIWSASAWMPKSWSKHRNVFISLKVRHLWNLSKILRSWTTLRKSDAWKRKSRSSRKRILRKWSTL